MNSFIKSNMQHNFIIFVIGVFALGLWLYDKEIYGDVFRFMLIALGLFWFIQKQFQPLKYLIIIAIVILGIAFTSKLLFAYLAHHYGDIEWLQNILEIAKRPINGEFKGFPSGHTTAAFIASALMWHFIGKKWGIFTFILACFVGYSRILSLWHTPLQVLAGAILGFIGSFILIYYIDKYFKKCIDKWCEKKL